MRESKSFCSSLGLAALAALASGAMAQQAQRPASHGNRESVRVQPERILLHPTQAEWREIVQRQASDKLAKRRVDAPAQEAWAQPTEETSAQDIFVPAPDVQPRPDHVQPSSPTDIERLGNCTGFPVIPSASLSTVGQTDGPDSFATLYYPPNPAGGVGPNHLMVMAPNFTTIQDRLGATISSVDTITFWSPTGAPTVRWCRLDYDGVNGRWHATALGGSGIGGTSILFAISDTDDPTLGWDFYTIPADPGLTTFADNLKKGYNQTWIAVTAEMYSSTVSGGNQGSRLYTFDVAGALAGGPVTANVFPANYVLLLTGQGNGTVNWRNIPTRSLDGSLAEIHLLNTRLATTASPIMQMVSITGTGAAPVLVPRSDSLFSPTTISSLFFVPVDYTNSRQGVFQVGDVRLIDPIPADGAFASTRSRLADAVVRNGKIFVVHNHGLPAPQTAAATQNGVGFYEIDPAGGINQTTGVGPINQQAQVTDGINTSLIYPSIAVNCAEDVLIGFSRADLTRDLEAAYCMRLGTDAPGSMGPITTLKAGESSWWQVGPPPATTLGAWGYYSSSAIDPNDDTTLWTLQPYAATRVGAADADSRWGGWWGRLGDCEIRPVITDQPDDVDSCIGNPVSFTVAATTGSNPLVYQWRLNGVDIPGANSATYSIPSATAGDEGVYDVIVCGCGLEVSQPAVLEFDEPTILVQPADYVAPLGDPAAFFIVASPSLGSLSYQWFHGATPVGIDDDILVIGSTVGADYGDYTCLVTDGCGTTLSAVARLLPENKKEKAAQGELNKLTILNHPSSQLLCVGDTATFSVTAFPASVTYEWRYNGSPIVPPETNAMLSVGPLALSDAGIYDCIVTYGMNSRVSLPAALTVYELPTITSQPGPVNQTVSPGSDVTYTVVATGPGTITYQWEKRPQSGGGGVVFSDIPGEVTPTLVLEDVTSADNGTYRCRITNECGFVRTVNLRLTVL
jgi:hypothetical protein